MSIPPTPKMSRVQRKSEPYESETSYPVPPKIHTEADSPTANQLPSMPALPSLPGSESIVIENTGVTAGEVLQSTESGQSNPWKIVFFVVLALILIECLGWVYLLFFR